MSEPLKSVHCRLSPEAHKVLAVLADVEEKDIAEMLRLIAEESLLGRVHVLTLAANKYRGVGFSGNLGDLAGGKGK